MTEFPVLPASRSGVNPTHNTMTTMRRSSGFTLLELMITLTIATILLTVALPSFTDAIRKNRLTTQASDVLVGFNLARSEAARLGVTTTICSSTDQSTCNGSDNWQNGWIVLNASTNNVIRIWNAMKGGATLVASAGDSKSDTSLSFRPDGLVSNPTSDGTKRLTLVLKAPNCGVNELRTVDISNIGITTIAKSNCP